MADPAGAFSEVNRLEELWAGEFGDAYVERNRAVGEHRATFWNSIIGRYPVKRVLEVGCNLGTNLGPIAATIPAQNVYGIDINLKALAALHHALPQVNAVWGSARELPFRDCWFDLTFTMGVLIHQPDSALPLVMAEIVRCSKRYILCGEYFSAEAIEVAYRDQPRSLFKRDYGCLYKELFPELSLLDTGFLSKEQGWDDVTYWLYEKN
jgi:pseudaminic acid biosynthesis-associated methylase